MTLPNPALRNSVPYRGTLTTEADRIILHHWGHRFFTPEQLERSMHGLPLRHIDIDAHCTIWLEGDHLHIYAPPRFWLFRLVWRWRTRHKR